MKLLIAAEGSEMTGRVARRFERAGWYVIVDDQEGILRAVRNKKPLDHTRILARASRAGVNIVVSDKLGRKEIRHLLAHRLRAAHERGVTIQEVMKKSQQGKLHTITEEELYRQVEGPVRTGFLAPPARPGRVHMSTPTIGSTPRGQHHLQQYSGRGH